MTLDDLAKASAKVFGHVQFIDRVLLFVGVVDGTGRRDDNASLVERIVHNGRRTGQCTRSRVEDGVDEANVGGNEHDRFLCLSMVAFDREPVNVNVGLRVVNAKGFDARLVVEVGQQGIETDLTHAQGYERRTDGRLVDEIQILAVVRGDGHGRRGNEHVLGGYGGDEMRCLSAEDVDLMFGLDEDQ